MNFYYRIQGTDDWTSVESTNDKVGVENIYNRESCRTGIYHKYS